MCSSDLFPIVKFFAKIFYFVFLLPFKVSSLIKGGRNSTISEISGIINKSSSKEVVFFIAPVLWNIPLFQRPQHIALNIGKQGVTYFYVTKWQSKNEIRDLGKNCYEVSAVDLDFNFILEIIERFKDKKKVFVKTYSTELEDISSFIDNVRRIGGKIIYEYVDEIDASIAGQTIPGHVLHRFEEAAKDENQSYIVATATKLYEDISFYRKKRFAQISNGVDYKHFSRKFDTKDLPIQMLKIYQEKKPLVGYYGAFASWMDYELLKFMAEKRPEYNYILIGVDYDGTLAASGVEEYKNIFVLPPVNYYELPRFAYFWDVCMIPFKINEVTKSTSPIKLFEYMALQKPIVTTAMPECKKYESVMTAETYDEFVKYLDKAMKLRTDKKYLELLDKEAKENTWESKARETIKLIRS